VREHFRPSIRIRQSAKGVEYRLKQGGIDPWNSESMQDFYLVKYPFEGINATCFLTTQLEDWRNEMVRRISSQAEAATNPKVADGSMTISEQTAFMEQAVTDAGLDSPRLCSYPAYTYLVASSNYTIPRYIQADKNVSFVPFRLFFAIKQVV